MSVSIKDKIKTIIELIKEPATLSALLSLKHSGYLVDIGWFNAFNTGASIGKNNEPIPWLTYPFLDFISPRLKKEFDIFEFGSGNSTLYFAPRVNSITSVEHNKFWFDKLKTLIPSNAKIIFKEFYEDGNYSRSILNSDVNYNIIIIDGEDRVNCVKYSIKCLKNNGVIILDDSDRPEYKEAIELMIAEGFLYLDFWGISPGYLNRKATSVFYKTSNCLGI